jgi:GntR family transcriptional regulator
MASPMYQLIAHDLRTRIESGELRPGDQLPTELELRDRYGAARNTVRDAVRILAALGLVVTKQGQGTFVARRLKPFVTTLSPSPEDGLTGAEGIDAFTEARSQHRQPSASVPRVETLPATREIAGQLDVPEGTVVITRRQGRYLDRQPWSLQTTAYPMDLARQGAMRLLMPQDIPGGAFAYLRDTLGVAEVGHRDLIQVRLAREDEARFFALADSGRVAVISCVRIGYRDAGERPAPFRATRTVFPADRNEFSIIAGRVPLAQPAPAEG